MKRIILHWTAGMNLPSALDKEHYHFLIDGKGNVHRGLHAVDANKGPLVEGEYAAHTRRCNTGSIGVALCGMYGAQERPFNAGTAPITETQVDMAAEFVAALCEQYGIAITRETVLTHAEVQRTLGIKQRNKWDIMWLPGMSAAGDPIAVGDVIRKKVQGQLAKSAPVAKPARATRSWFSRLWVR